MIKEKYEHKMNKDKERYEKKCKEMVMYKITFKKKSAMSAYRKKRKCHERLYEEEQCHERLHKEK